MANANMNGNYSSEDLHAWLQSVPLSRAKKNIARDFADGVLVAEVIAHYFPKAVELHNYCSASSWVQKKVNWQTLNRRVFSKLGIRVPDEMITQVTLAKPGVAEQILWDVRKKIESLKCIVGEDKSQVFCKARSKKNSSEPYASSSTTALPVDIKDEESYERPHTVDTFNPQLTYRVADYTQEPDISSEIRTEYRKFPRIESEKSCSEDAFSDCSLEKDPGFSFLEDGKRAKLGATIPGIEVNKVVTGGSTNHSIIETLVNSTKMTIPVAAALQGHQKMEGGSSGGPPAQIIYRGHKMIPLHLLEEKDKEIKALESCNRSLTHKIYRLETLVSVKDQRIEDLTHQLHNLRSMYERITERIYSAQ